jgi:hypothetical protein
MSLFLVELRAHSQRFKSFLDREALVDLKVLREFRDQLVPKELKVFLD